MKFSKTLLSIKEEKMKFFKMLLGICETIPPADGGCWRYSDGKIEVHLNRSPELEDKGGAVRLEGNGSPERVLLIHDRDGQFRAYKNRCTHAGRRIDTYDETKLLKCCSVFQSVFDYEGNVVSGAAKKPLTQYKVVQKDGMLTVFVN